jgi:hypothetical protein
MWGEKFVVLFVPVSFYAKPSYLIKWLKAYKTSFQPLREYEREYEKISVNKILL